MTYECMNEFHDLNDAPPAGCSSCVSEPTTQRSARIVTVHLPPSSNTSQAAYTPAAFELLFASGGLSVPQLE